MNPGLLLVKFREWAATVASCEIPELFYNVPDNLSFNILNNFFTFIENKCFFDVIWNLKREKKSW